MKKRMLLCAVITLLLVLATGCGKSTVAKIMNSVEPNEFNKNYEPVIEEDVKKAEVNSPTLQEELAEVETMALNYENKVQETETQQEMNVAERWPLKVWTTELDNLKIRITEIVDETVRDQFYTEQNGWSKMIDEVTAENIGTREEGGSLYPTLQAELWSTFTRNRAYILAAKLAALKGESFDMPEKDPKYGSFVDNQGTDSVYGFLITKMGWTGDEAVISVYRTGKLRGVFTASGDKDYIFTSDDEKVKGLIRINGWNGASFEVNEVSGESPFHVGDKFEFNYVF
ncbi:MAG: DUF1311 domain-containing protein [Lachnospiraceae bacterium]|nr:DUF1311 domain-containing protein [Lachnospiraceae bacterium]